MSVLTVHRREAPELAHRAVEVVTARLGAGAAPAEVAVLARVASALLPVQVALTEAGVAHTSPLDASVLSRTGIRTALAYLRLGLDLERVARDDVLETINRPARKVKSAITPLLARSARTSAAQLAHLADGLDATHRQRFEEYLGDLYTLEGAITAGADTAECLEVIRDRIGLGEAMDALDASRTRPEGSSHGDDLDALQQLAALQPDPAAFADWLADRLRTPADPDGVHLSTVHRVKGREWAHVVVFAANQGLFPHRLADDVEEERRVFHVAVTRCRSSVDVLADRARTSPFADELTAPATGRPTASPSDPAPPREVAVATFDGDDAVAAAGLGLTLPGGVTGRVQKVTRRGAQVRLDAVDAVVGVGFGDVVTVDGRRCRLAAPRRAVVQAPADDPADTATFEALRAWRARTAAETGVPAYLVFHDRHLHVIAGRRPRTLRELAECPGVGPAKLERFGDDVLDVVAAHAG